jgi:hypothetical protein
LLIAKHNPALTTGIRVLDSTAVATLPAFVTAVSTPASTISALRDAFASASRNPWFREYADTLLIEGFAAVDTADYARTLAWDREANAAGYAYPA